MESADRGRLPPFAEAGLSSPGQRPRRRGHRALALRRHQLRLPPADDTTSAQRQLHLGVGLLLRCWRNSFRNYPRLSTDPFASYEYGPNPNDERSHVTFSGIGHLGNVQVAPILQFGSPRPYPLTNSSNTLNTGGGTAIAVVVPTSNPTTGSPMPVTIPRPRIASTV